MTGLANQLIETYLELEQQAQALKLQVRNLDPKYGAMTLGLNDLAWRQGHHKPHMDHHYWASEIFGCLDHRHDGDGRDTWQLAGVLVVPSSIIELARQLNRVKGHLATLVNAYRDQQKSAVPSVTFSAFFKPPHLEQQLGSGQAARAIIQRIGASRVHLRHCTRQIVCLDDYPKFISLSWVRQRRSIQKISVESCIQKLEKLNRDSESSHIDVQINKLNRLTLTEQKLLRQVQTVKYPSIKTKVYWEDGTDSHLGYLSMPALVPAGTIEQLPPMTNITPTPPPARPHRRSDNRLPEEPFCPSIRVYLATAEIQDTKPKAKTMPG